MLDRVGKVALHCQAWICHLAAVSDLRVAALFVVLTLPGE
jgi:hypothetical protein